jgi:hypothetical protein
MNTTDRVQMPEGPLRLETDLRILLLLLNEGRYRTLQRTLGLSRDQANLVSLVLMAMLAQGTRDRVHRLMSGPPPWPEPVDTAFGVAALRELVQSIAGPAARDTSMFGTLVAIAAFGGVCLPVVRRSMRATEVRLHHVQVAFRHRYGVHAARAARAARKVTELAKETAESAVGSSEA